MKKRAIGVLTLLVILLGSFATLTVASPITDLGTIRYSETQNAFLASGELLGDANLTFVYSDMNESSLLIEKMWFDDLANKTTYTFTTQKTTVEWWFIPGMVEFIYLDENSDRLYRVNVNYDQIFIPGNPYEADYQRLLENYTSILSNYTLTNETLADLTLQFDKLTGIYNLTKENYLTVSENLTNITEIYLKLDADYNLTHALWISSVNNVTHYQSQYEGLVTDYNQLEKDHDDLSEAAPWYVCIAIFGSLLFAYILLRRKKIVGTQQGATDKITTGYGKIHSAIDNHVLSRFRKDTGGKPTEWIPEEKIQKETKIQIPDETPIDKENEEKTINDEPPAQTDALTIMNDKIDANARAADTKHDVFIKKTNTMLEDLSKKIDQIVGTKA